MLNERHRATVITWLVVYPLITMLLYVFEPFMVSWPIPMRTLFLTAILVPIMVLWAMPNANQFVDKVKMS
jgi:antibiotic biosynthesis monooxygenase (ABM) superfamily enzyme